MTIKEKRKLLGNKATTAEISEILQKKGIPYKVIGYSESTVTRIIKRGEENKLVNEVIDGLLYERGVQKK